VVTAAAGAFLLTSKMLIRKVISRLRVKEGLSTLVRNNSSSAYRSVKYEAEMQRSLQNPEEYWAEIAENTVWTKKYDRVLDNSNPPFAKWFPGGELSMCYNAVDRHVDEGFGEQAALIWDSPITGNKDTITFKQLQSEVSRVAGLLSKMGVGKGDRVMVYMPMVPEAVIAMLAIVRLGAAHSVVFGGFAAPQLATRIEHAKPKVLISASCGIEPGRIIKYKPNVDEAIRLAGGKVKSLVFQREECLAEISSNDLVWQDEVPGALPHDCVPVDANDPLYILYTSGTTGQPKGVQHPTGGHAVVNKWTMDAIYGVYPGEAWWAASDLGWIVGHEYTCYSPLLARNTSIVYEGKPVGTPDPGQFFRVIQEHNVKGMFTAPTAIRAIEREDPTGEFAKKYDISCLRQLFVAGEHCDYKTRLWAQEHFKVPVLDNWWQTETGHALTSTCIGLGHSLDPPKDVSGMPVPGWDIKVIREDQTEAAPNELGRIVAKLPMPPGCMSTLYMADERFKETYFSTYPGYYDTMDAGIKDEHGYIKVMARDDDVINVAGHRLSTSAIEEVLLRHPLVADAAVMGVADKLKGQLPLGLVIPRQGDCSNLEKELVQLVRKDLGAVAAFRLVAQVTGLPRTRSGKTARKTIADLADGKKVKIPPTIEDPTVYVGVKAALLSLGYASNAPDPEL